MKNARHTSMIYVVVHFIKNTIKQNKRHQHKKFPILVYYFSFAFHPLKKPVFITIFKSKKIAFPFQKSHFDFCSFIRVQILF